MQKNSRTGNAQAALTSGQKSAATRAKNRAADLAAQRATTASRLSSQQAGQGTRIYNREIQAGASNRQALASARKGMQNFATSGGRTSGRGSAYEV